MSIHFIEVRIIMRKNFTYNLFFNEEGVNIQDTMQNLLLNYIKNNIDGQNNLIESFNIN